MVDLGGRAYRTIFVGQLRSELQYRVSFIVFLLSQAVITGLDMFQIVVIFDAVDSIGSWSRDQVLFLGAMSTFAFGLADLFASPVELLDRHVKQGTLDNFLIRPAPVLSQLLAHEFALRRGGRVVQSAVLLIVLVVTGSLPSGGLLIGRVLLAVLALAGAALTFSATFVLLNSVCFWSPDARESANAATYGGALASQYPVNAFERWFRRAMLFLTPLPLIVYAPAIYIARAPNPLGIPLWLQWCGPLVFIPVTVLAAVVWSTGLRRYEGAGS